MSHIYFSINTQLAQPPLFPYTTLFRSKRGRSLWIDDDLSAAGSRTASPSASTSFPFDPLGAPVLPKAGAPPLSRSEEHTSELESRENLVCRLLLEKKNKTYDE